MSTWRIVRSVTVQPRINEGSKALYAILGELCGRTNTGVGPRGNSALNETLQSLHLAGMVLGLGGLLAQLILLTKAGKTRDADSRIVLDRQAAVSLALIQAPGVIVATLTGLALTWLEDWAPLREGWLQFKLLFLFWIVLATRLMSRNIRNISSLRAQCAEADSDRLVSLRDNHFVIAYLTLLAFLFAVAFSLWKPF